MDVDEKVDNSCGAQVPNAVSEFVQTYHPSVAAALYGSSRHEDWFHRSLLAGLLRLEQLDCVRLERNGDDSTDTSIDDSASYSADEVSVEFLSASTCADTLDKETYCFLASFKDRDAPTLGLHEVSSFAANFPEAFEKRAGLWRKAVLATPTYQSCYLPQRSPSANDRAPKPASSSSKAPFILCVAAALVFLLQPLGSMGSLVLAIVFVLMAVAARKASQLQGGTRGGTQNDRPAADPSVSPERAAFFDGCERFRAWCGSSEASRALTRMDERERIALCAMTIALDCAIEPAVEQTAPGVDPDDGVPTSGGNGPANKDWDDGTSRGRGGIDLLDVWFAMNAFDLAHHMFGDHAFGGHGDAAWSDDAADWPDDATDGDDALSGGFAAANEDSGQASGGFTSEDHTQLSGGFSGGGTDSGGFVGGFSDRADRSELSGGFSGGERDTGGFGGGDSSGRDAMFAGGFLGSLFGASFAFDDEGTNDGDSDDFSSNASDSDFGDSDSGGLFGGFDFGGNSDSGGLFDSFDFGGSDGGFFDSFDAGGFGDFGDFGD